MSLTRYIGTVLFVGSSCIIVGRATSYFIRTYHKCIFATQNPCLFCQKISKVSQYNQNRIHTTSNTGSPYSPSIILNVISSILGFAWTARDVMSIEKIKKFPEETMTKIQRLSSTGETNTSYTPVYQHFDGPKETISPPPPPLRSSSLRNGKTFTQSYSSGNNPTRLVII